MEQGLQVRCQVKTVTFSHIYQLEIIRGGARVAGKMSGKDSHSVTAINWRLSRMEQGLQAGCGVWCDW